MPKEQTIPPEHKVIPEMAAVLTEQPTQSRQTYSAGEVFEITEDNRQN